MEKPSYFAVIPASVRYDKRLKPIERLLFGEITCLTNKDGYCFASSSYFAELYGVTRVSVSSYISNLAKCGYIDIVIENKCYRKIFLKQGFNEFLQGVKENEQGVKELLQGCENSLTPTCKKTFTQNNTSSNNLKNNGKEISKEKHRYGEYHNVLLSDDELAKLKSEFPSDWQERIERVSGYCASKGKTYKNYLATIRNWARNETKKANQPAPMRKNDAQAGYERAKQLLGITEDEE